MSNQPNTEKVKPSKSVSAFPFSSSWEHMDKLFDNFRSHWPLHFLDKDGSKDGEVSLSPNVDIKETKTSFLISAELPGVDVSEINIDLSDDLITISGEKTTEKEKDTEDNYHVVERRHGHFMRSFNLPSSVDQQHIKADFKNGVLHIVMPKSAKAQQKQRKITIESA